MRRSRSPSRQKKRAQATSAVHDPWCEQAKLDYKKGNPVLCNDVPRPLCCQACFKGLWYPSKALAECWVSEENVRSHPTDDVSKTMLLTKPVGKDYDDKTYFVVCQWHDDWLKRLWLGEEPANRSVIRVRSPGSSSLTSSIWSTNSGAIRSVHHANG